MKSHRHSITSTRLIMTCICLFSLCCVDKKDPILILRWRFDACTETERQHDKYIVRGKYESGEDFMIEVPDESRKCIRIIGEAKNVSNRNIGGVKLVFEMKSSTGETEKEEYEIVHNGSVVSPDYIMEFNTHIHHKIDIDTARLYFVNTSSNAILSNIMVYNSKLSTGQKMSWKCGLDI